MVVWKTDWRVEQWLDAEKIGWTWTEDIPLAHIDNSPTNIRLLTHGKFNDDAVLSMAISMEQGAAFPAPVLWKRQSGRFEPINGAHRVRAADTFGVKKLSAYVVSEGDPNVIDQLKRTSNTIESTQGYSEAERVEQAVALVEKDNLTAKAAGAKMKVRTAQVTDRLRAKKVTAELLDEGLDENFVRSIALTERKDLNVIRNPQIRALVVKMSFGARLPAEERKQLYKQVANAVTEKEAHDIIAEWEKKVAGRYKTATQKHSPFAKLSTIGNWYDQMEKMLKDEKMPPDVQRVIDELEKTAAHVSAMAKMLRKMYGKAA